MRTCFGVGEPGDPQFTISAAHSHAVAYPVKGRIFCLQGNGIDRQDKNGCAGRGWREDVSYTINTIDRHAVCYAVHENDRQEVRLSEEKAYSLTVGGGKPGQGYPCVLLCPEREFLRSLPADGDERNARNEVPLRLRRGRCADRRGDDQPRNPDGGGVTETLRAQSHQALPILCFMGGQGAKARSLGLSDRVAPSLKTPQSGGNTVPDVCYRRKDE